MRRVVVTGMGAITPVGNDIDTMWANMLAGVNGVEKSHHLTLPTSRFTLQVL